MALATIFSGVMISKVGYYTPFLIAGICLASIGSGLLNTLTVGTAIRNAIGFQILVGFGFGLSNQAPNMAAQTILKREDVSIGVSLLMFAQTLSGSIFVSIGQNVLDNALASGIRSFTNVMPQQIDSAGATGLLALVPADKHVAALEVYNSALGLCFRIAVIMSCIAIIGGLLMEWRSVKGNKGSLPSEANASHSHSADEASDIESKDLEKV
jgi:hypothetical protein